MVYSGIDGDKDNCFITAVDDKGEIMKQERLRNDYALILEYCASLQVPTKPPSSAPPAGTCISSKLVALSSFLLTLLLRKRVRPTPFPRAAV
jgi:hypothetical protein